MEASIYFEAFRDQKESWRQEYPDTPRPREQSQSGTKRIFTDEKIVYTIFPAAAIFISGLILFSLYKAFETATCTEIGITAFAGF